jgi:uncharacterized protein (UPF0276 family)
MFKIGTGFNVGFIKNKANPAHLFFPKEAILLELGLEELITFENSLMKLKNEQDFSISLHIARSPITENNLTQKEYLDNVINICKKNNFYSIGFHLTGPRKSNIVKYGFSSNYNASNSVLESNAIQFIQRLQESLCCEIWLENTNFYSSNVNSPLALWESIRRICEKTNVKLIVDLAHHFIDCQNVGVPPDLLFGAIPWGYVREIHLSGVTQSQDGAFHDGHSQPIHESLWSYLEMIVTYFINDLSSLFVTVEHTDFIWTKEKNLFYYDFKKLCDFREKLNSKNLGLPNQIANSAEKYAQSRLKKFLKLHLADTILACQKLEIDFDFLFEHWLSSINFADGNSLVFSSYEEDANAHNSKKMFVKFLMENYPDVRN